MSGEKIERFGSIPNINDINAMFFDMDDTLVKYREPVLAGFESIREIVPELKETTAEEMEEQFRKLFSFDPVFRKEISYKDDVNARIGEILSSHGRSVSDAELKHFGSVFWRAFWKKRRMVEGAIDLLQICKTKNIPVAIITNGNPQIQFRTMIRLKLHDFVDVILTPRNAEELKPNPLLFMKAMNLFNVDPESVVMVGDSISSDIKGAINSGIVPIWFNNSKRNKPSDVDVAEVESFCELADIIR